MEDATKALEATNGITLEKNGQVLRVAYAKSTHGPASGGSQSNSLAAAAIEAASFAQQVCYSSLHCKIKHLLFLFIYYFLCSFLQYLVLCKLSCQISETYNSESMEIGHMKNITRFVSKST